MTSRIRSRTRRCHLGAPLPSNPVTVLACTGVDGEQTLVPWSRALAHPVAFPSLAPLLDPVTPWDLAATERHVAGLILVDELRRMWRAQRRLRKLPGPRYTRRGSAVEAEPLRQMGVTGDLAAALRQIPDVEATPKVERRAA